VPLSEEEQRILREIEQRYYTTDRKSAERIQQTTLPRYLARNCRWAAVGFFLGLVVLLVSFASSWFLGIVGFLVMVASALWFTQNARKMGRHGWQEFSKNVQSHNINDRLEETRKRLKRRMGDGNP
jgi:cobalamin biosynthesis protein CobD/CbiB